MGPKITEFDPGAGDGRAYRDALGQFATGVTVVTAAGPEGPVGMTANSFASVSLEPPLVLWSPSTTSARFGVFRDAQRYAIHVLCADQQEMAQSFARSGSHGFAQFDHVLSPQGVPLLSGCLARFECIQAACHPAGDHMIILGHVQRAQISTGAPLVFLRGGYCGARAFGDAQ